MKLKRPYPKVMISTKAERSVKNGHPWIYGEEIRHLKGAPRNGELVDVLAGNAYMGYGILQQYQQDCRPADFAQHQ